MGRRSFLMRVGLAALACLSAAALTGCDLVSGGPEVRYRITVEVNTPQGLRSGSSVWSFKLRPGDMDRGYDSKFRGEAVAVDLPNGQTLFAATVGISQSGRPVDEMGTLPETVYWRFGVTTEIERETLGDRRKILEFIARLSPEPIALDCQPPSRECPLLVRFGDTGDSRTVEAVDPGDLAAAFGPGVSLRRILFELTSDRPEFKLGKRLPWLSEYPEPSLNPGHSPIDHSIGSTLTHGGFVRR
jgi:hypothetical protein